MLEARADINLPCKKVWSQATEEWVSVTGFGYAIYSKKPELVALFLGHNPDISTEIDGKPAVEWASLYSRNICTLLKKHMAPVPTGFLLGDLVEAAGRGSHSLATYIEEQTDIITQHQLEQGLYKSIIGYQFMSAVTLLQYGVDANGLTLPISPLGDAIEVAAEVQFVDLLLGYKADHKQGGLLAMAVDAAFHNDSHVILNRLLKLQYDQINGLKALVNAAEYGDIISADMLLRRDVHINSTGLPLSPLQSAARYGKFDMVKFLILRGANVNHPAHPAGGLTTLQAALSSDQPIESAQFLLCHSADASAPPALVGGVTALETFFYNPEPIGELEEWTGLTEKLLEAGATVNRPDGKPSSAVHGVISKDVHKY